MVQSKTAVCCSSEIDEKEKKDHTSQKLRHVCLGRVIFLIEQVGGLKRKEGRREQGSERSVKGRGGENV